MKNTEETNSQNSRQSFSIFFKKKFVRAAATILIFLVVLIISMPLGGKWYLQYWLEKNGADHVAISTLFINPFVGVFRLEGVDVSGLEKSLLSTTRSTMDLEILSLFQKEVKIAQANYEQLKIYLEQHEDGRWTIASYTTAGEKRAETEVVSNETGIDEAGSEWIFSVDELTVDDCIISIRTPKFSSEIVIERAFIENFSNRDGAEPAQFFIKGLLGEVPVTIDSSSLTVLPDFVISAEIDVEGFDSKLIQPFLAEAISLEGLLSLKGEFNLNISGDEPVFSFKGDLAVENGKAVTSEISVSAEKIGYQGVINNSSDAERLNVDGALQLGGLSLQLPADELALQNQQLDLKGQVDLGMGKKLSMSTELDLSALDFSLKMGDFAYQHRKILWKGTVKNEDELLYQADGTLKVEKLNYADKTVELESDGLSLAGKTDINIAETVSVNSSAAVEGGFFNLALQDISYAHNKISWAGKLDYSREAAGGAGNLKVSGLKLKADSDAKQFESALQGIEWDGSVQYSFIEDDLFSALLAEGKLAAKILNLILAGTTPLDISLASLELNEAKAAKEGFGVGELKLSAVELFSTLAQRTVLDLANLDITQLAIPPDWSASAASADFKEIQLFPSTQEKQHSAKIEQLNLNNLAYHPDNGVHLGRLGGNDLKISLIRDKNGSLNWGDNLSSISKKGDQPKTVPSTSVRENTSYPFKIDFAEFTGENLIHFVDYTLAIPFTTDVVLKKVNAENIDTTGDKEIKVDLAAELEGRAPLTVKGTLQPFNTGEQETSSAKLDFKLRNYPLANLSPYLVQSVGTGIESGQMKLTGSFALTNNVVDIKNDLLLKKLRTKAVSPELAKELDNKLPIPLEAALELLKDSKDNISLSVPIKGPLEKVNFDLSDAFVKALSKAVVPAASSYLMYALGPYGALAYVGMKLGENILHIELPPVEFEPGAIELTAEHLDYLTRIGTLLNDKKSTSDMQICPVVNIVTELGVEGDFTVDELTEQETAELRELGQQRARLVQNYLAEEQRVDDDRLLLCITRLVKNEDSRVELQPEQ